MPVQIVSQDSARQVSMTAKGGVKQTIKKVWRQIKVFNVF
jgi:hypothetical protein